MGVDPSISLTLFLLSIDDLESILLILVQKSPPHIAFAQRQRAIYVHCILEVCTRFIRAKMAVHIHVLGTLG